MFKIVPGLPTANILSQQKFQFRTTALLRPTARTLQLSVAFCACIVQQAKCNVCVLQCSKQKYSVLLHNAAVHSTMQTSPLCVHFKTIAIEPKGCNVCYRLWLPAVSISSIQLSVHIVYCGKEQVIGLS